MMNKNNAVRILQIAGIAAVLLLLIFTAIELRVRQKMNLRTTYIASRDIPPRTRIEETDLIEVKIPEAYLQDYACMDASEIIGKYTEIQGMIPAGSPFYQSMLYDAAALPDFPTVQLREGQSAYTLETDLGSLGGTMVPGQRVDIFGALTRKDGTPLTGCLIQHARILSIKDHRGLNIDEEESDGIPYLAVLAVNTEDLKWLSACEQCGQVRLFTSSSSYDNASEAKLLEDSEVLQYLKTQMDAPEVSEEISIVE